MPVTVIRPLPVFEVTRSPYNARGNGSTNDRTGILTAIAAAESAGGGIVFFPEAEFLNQVGTAGWPGSATLSYANALAYQGLVINGDNVHLSCAPGAKLSIKPAGGDPDTNWYVTGNGSYPIWRGGGIWITGGTTYAERRKNVTIEGLELDGNYTYTGVHTAANTTTGDGWDVSHKGIWCHNDRYLDNIIIRGCHIHNFAGELIYSGGSDTDEGNLGRFLVEGNEVHDTNGSAISLGGRDVVIARNRIHTAAGAGIEDAVNDGHHIVDRNEVWDTLLDSYSLIGYDGGYGGYTVCYNRSRNSSQRGIALYSAWNCRVYANIVVDATNAGVNMAIGAAYTNDDVRNVDIFGNTILADAKSPTTGINATLTTAEAKAIRIFSNRVGRTADAEANGFLVGEPIAILSTADFNEIDMFDNAIYGSHGDSTAARAIRSLLTTTSATNVATRKFSAKGIALVSISYEVITAATDVTVVVQHVASNGVTTNTFTVQALTNKATGLYALDALAVPVELRGTVKVRVTAGTADQVYVTATIREA